MRSGAGMEVHGVSEKNLLKLVMKKRCAHTDKNLKLLVRMHMSSARQDLGDVSSAHVDAKSGVSSRELFVNLRAGPEMPHSLRHFFHLIYRMEKFTVLLCTVNKFQFFIFRLPYKLYSV